MILAEINWIDISVSLLLVAFVIVCLLMSLLILMQRPKQEGLGAAFGGGVTDQVFGARTTNVLQKGTVYLGSAFFLLSLVLAILISKQTKQKSLLEPSANTPSEVTPAEQDLASEDAATTDVTVAEDESSLADELAEPVSEPSDAPEISDSPVEASE